MTSPRRSWSLGLAFTRFPVRLWQACASLQLAMVLIGITWYGVNYWFGSGLHSYASGTGGQWEVGIAAACNWLFLAAATVRYLAEVAADSRLRLRNLVSGSL